MLFAQPNGVMGNVVSKGVNEFIIPNYRQTWANIRKITSAPEAVRHLSFKSFEYSVRCARCFQSGVSPLRKNGSPANAEIGKRVGQNHSDACRGVKFMCSKGSADTSVTAADNEDRYGPPLMKARILIPAPQSRQVNWSASEILAMSRRHWAEVSARSGSWP